MHEVNRGGKRTRHSARPDEVTPSNEYGDPLEQKPFCSEKDSPHFTSGMLIFWPTRMRLGSFRPGFAAMTWAVVILRPFS